MAQFKIMRLAILAAFLSFVGMIFASDQIDSEFLALQLWSTDLSSKAEIWNEHCHNNLDSPDCMQTAQVMATLQTFFLQVAKRYCKTGDDAAATLRFNVIQHDIHLSEWNIECGGKMMDKAKFLDCTERSNKIDAEGNKLKEDADKWQSKNL
jgi:hypothetical protein